ncbi:hypothetical protein C8R43DRAFT_950017 [Mycena crocata]|nr:hypothetical protein C8R43DRAFT_950017 [Mycena crocata]
MARPGKTKPSKSSKKKKTLRFFTVTEEIDGALVCNCPEYKATGKPCTEILAARLFIEFGPAKPYLEDPQGPDTHGPKAKGKGKKTKQAPKPKRGSDGRNKQRPAADHRVEAEIDDFLEHIEKGWQAFGSGDESDQFSDEEGPTPKKSKQDKEGTRALWKFVTLIPFCESS